jgi:hypothetical protein
MKKLIVCFSIMTALTMGAKAQSITAPTVNAPKYVNIDSSLTTVHTMNKILLEAMPGYQLAPGDGDAAETAFIFTDASSQQLRVLYASKPSRGQKVISRISIVGDKQTLEVVYKKLFNSTRKTDVDKHTYQLDYFDYNGKKHYVRFDPDTENNLGADNWAIIIGKY